MTVMELLLTNDTLYSIGWGASFRPKQATVFEDIALIQLQLLMIILQHLSLHLI
jgi:hypothetical protein